MVMNRITIKKLKVAKFASEETLCMSAEVYFDGKLLGTAQNDGHGGNTNLYRTPKCPQSLIDDAETWAKSLPDVVARLSDDPANTETFTYKMDLEHVIDELVQEELAAKELAAAFKRSLKKVTLLDGGKVYTLTAKDKSKTLTPEFIAAVQKKYPAATILNNLPTDAAFDLYKKAMQS